MTEHPIIISSELIPPTLEGWKTMTRRVIKPQPEAVLSRIENTGLWTYTLCEREWKCPYGKVGGRLWVRETMIADEDGVHYEARLKQKGLAPPAEPYIEFTDEQLMWFAEYGKEDCYSVTIPSIHMPRWASRINREITNIRVERLQEITPKDVLAEGFKGDVSDGLELLDKFTILWNSLHKKPKPIIRKGVITHYVSYPWEDIRETRKHRGKPWYVFGNPYCWVIEFKK